MKTKPVPQSIKTKIAKFRAERYDPHYPEGLTPESAPLLEDIARFWYDYYGLDY